MNLKNSFKIKILLVIIILFIVKSPVIIQAMTEGIKLCISIIIPSLFPFMVISSAFVGNLDGSSLKTIFKITNKLFGISIYGAGAFICGILCGYPIGAKCAAELYAEGRISKSEAQSLMAYCNNSGPLFIIGAIGLGMLHSFKCGVFLYIVHIFSAIVAALILKPYTYIRQISSVNLPKSKPLTQCICESVTNVLNVCGFILMFSVVNKITQPFFALAPHKIRLVLPGIVEISNGIKTVCTNATGFCEKMTIISFVLGWSGISVHMQVSNIAKPHGICLKKYYITRLFTAILSAIITWLFTGGLDELVLNIRLIVLLMAATSILCSLLFTIKSRKHKSKPKIRANLQTTKRCKSS